MKWPWVSRKRYEEHRQRLDAEACRQLTRATAAEAERDKSKRNSETLQGVVGTLRAELIAKKQDIKVLMQKLAEKDTVIEAQRKEIERLEKSLPVSLNPRRKHFHGAGGIKERLEAEAANEKKSTVPEGAN